MLSLTSFRCPFRLIRRCFLGTWICYYIATYIYIYKYLQKHNQTQYTNFNERTNTLLYKNISLSLYSRKGWCRLCVREMNWRRGQTVILTQSSSFDHSSTSSPSWLGCSTMGHWRPKALRLPLVLNSASCPQLTQAVCVLVMLLFNIHLLPLFFRLFTQVHLLIDGSIESQYVTMLYNWIIFINNNLKQNCLLRITINCLKLYM